MLDVEKLNELVSFADKMSGSLESLAIIYGDVLAAELVEEYKTFRFGEGANDVSGESEASTMQQMPVSEPSEQADSTLPPIAEVGLCL